MRPSWLLLAGLLTACAPRSTPPQAHVIQPGEMVTRYVCVPLDYSGPATLTLALPGGAAIRHVLVTGCPVGGKVFDELPPGAAPVPQTMPTA